MRVGTRIGDSLKWPRDLSSEKYLPRDISNIHDGSYRISHVCNSNRAERM